MDKVSEYRKLIMHLLSKMADQLNRQKNDDVDSYVVFDEERDHYLLMRLGWSQQHRVRGNTIYVRIKNGKFYIEEDWSEDGIASALLEAGVSKSDIVLAFYEPQMRPYTEFATA